MAEVTQRLGETRRVRTLVFAVPGWPGHLAGHHVDVRLTAEDGYQAERSYSISSPPEDGDRVAITVERMSGFARTRRSGPLTIEGELVAKSTGAASEFSVGDRVFHQKFGNGDIVAVDGNKLTIQFDKAGEKRVVDSFVERA